jgi:hypothetical protein
MKRWEQIVSLFASAYLLLSFYQLSGYLFNPLYIADDTAPHYYPLLSLKVDSLFESDLTSLFMRNYIPPLHWSLEVFTTQLFSGTVMASHFISALQLALVCCCLLVLVTRAVGISAALFTLALFFHTPSLVEHWAGGLARGWAIGLLALYFVLLQKRKHYSILALAFVSCFLYPPVPLLIFASYAFVLLIEFRKLEHLRALLPGFLVAAAASFLALLYFTDKPEQLGELISYQQALNLPELGQSGRFRLLPFSSPIYDITRFLALPFTTKHSPAGLTALLVACIAIVLILLSAWQSRECKQRQDFVGFLSIVLGSVSLYILARVFAFQLFMPVRFLMYSLPLSMIAFFSCFAFRLDCSKFLEAVPLRGAVNLFILGLLFVSCTGLALHRDYGFDTRTDKKFLKWVSSQTEVDALFAGEPGEMDALLINNHGRVFVSHEVINPLYSEYHKHITKRLEAFWNAYYASTWNEVLSSLSGTGIDYLVVRRQDFIEGGPKKIRTFSPYLERLAELSKLNPEKFALQRLLENRGEGSEFIVYEDKRVVVLDLRPVSTDLGPGPKLRNSSSENYE